MFFSPSVRDNCHSSTYSDAWIFYIFIFSQVFDVSQRCLLRERLCPIMKCVCCLGIGTVASPYVVVLAADTDARYSLLYIRVCEMEGAPQNNASRKLCMNQAYTQVDHFMYRQMNFKQLERWCYFVFKFLFLFLLAVSYPPRGLETQSHLVLVVASSFLKRRQASVPPKCFSCNSSIFSFTSRCTDCAWSLIPG